MANMAARRADMASMDAIEMIEGKNEGSSLVGRTVRGVELRERSREMREVSL